MRMPEPEIAIAAEIEIPARGAVEPIPREYQRPTLR